MLDAQREYLERQHHSDRALHDMKAELEVVLQSSAKQEEILRENLKGKDIRIAQLEVHSIGLKT